MVRDNQLPKKHFDHGTYLVVAVVVGFALLTHIDPAFAQDTGAVDDARFGQICNNAMSYIEGSFGSLLAAVAGMGAIVASAAGGFRMAWACLVVSVGCFILRNYLDLFFQGLCQ